MKLGENDYLMRQSFSPTFIRTGGKFWPCADFFTQTLFQKISSLPWCSDLCPKFAFNLGPKHFTNNSKLSFTLRKWAKPNLFLWYDGGSFQITATAGIVLGVAKGGNTETGIDPVGTKLSTSPGLFLGRKRLKMVH